MAVVPIISDEDANPVNNNQEVCQWYETGDCGGECMLDCPGIEDVNSSEDPHEACDWIISTFGNDPGFASCMNDCDEETMMEIYEIVEACFDCLSDTALD